MIEKKAVALFSSGLDSICQWFVALAVVHLKHELSGVKWIQTHLIINRRSADIYLLSSLFPPKKFLAPCVCQTHPVCCSLVAAAYCRESVLCELLESDALCATFESSRRHRRRPQLFCRETSQQVSWRLLRTIKKGENRRICSTLGFKFMRAQPAPSVPGWAHKMSKHNMISHFFLHDCFVFYPQMKNIHLHFQLWRLWFTRPPLHSSLVPSIPFCSLQC